MRRKIAIVNQRYGIEVNGGSEQYTKMIAEKLDCYYDVEVLTTCALEYTTWKNFYKSGEQVVNGIKVKRFCVDKPRKMSSFNRINNEYFQCEHKSIEMELEWFKEQGPLSTELIKYIDNNKDEYDIFIFITYLYYPAVMGLPKVSNKSILIPTAHDEPYIYFNYYQSYFQLPKALVFLTEEEMTLIHRLFHNQNIKHEVIGVGIDVNTKVNTIEFKKRYSLQDYFIYVGRIDESKGCGFLFNYFLEYKKRSKRDLKLVLMGKAVMDIPQHDDIVNLGFVSEEEKFSGISGARFLVLPSAFESLSMSVLEAMTLGVPVVVNGNCEVLKGHCVKSNGGLYYKNFYEFEGCVNYIMDKNEAHNIMSENAKKYIENNYQWDVVIKKICELVEFVVSIKD